MTRNGQKILDLIESSNEHMTAQEIYDSLQAKSNDMVRATVYNNLNTLVSEGKVRKVVLEGQPDRYDKIIRHDHLVCSKCGKIADLYLDDITKKLEEQTGVHIDSYDLKLFYVCDECKVKEKS